MGVRDVDRELAQATRAVEEAARDVRDDLAADGVGIVAVTYAAQGALLAVGRLANALDIAAAILADRRDVGRERLSDADAERAALALAERLRCVAAGLMGACDADGTLIGDIGCLARGPGAA
jgi:hypothetical protein